MNDRSPSGTGQGIAGLPQAQVGACDFVTPVAKVGKQVRLPRRTVNLDNPCPALLFEPCKQQAFILDSCGERLDIECKTVEQADVLVACCSEECCPEDYSQVVAVVDEDGAPTFWAKTSDGHVYKLNTATGLWVEKECEPIARPECIRGVTIEVGAEVVGTDGCLAATLEVEKRILHADAVVDKTSVYCPP